VIRFVERRHRNMVSLGDVIDRGDGRERVVDLRSPTFFLTVPARRKDPALGTLTVMWRDLA
jgi:hypothetical protein